LTRADGSCGLIRPGGAIPGIMTVMDKSPGPRRRHLSLVRGVPGDPDAIPDRRTPALFVVDSESVGRDLHPPRDHDTAMPAGTTTADLLRFLGESGAPQPFLDHAVTFGDDVDGLFRWLHDYGPVFSERQWAADVLDHWTPLLTPATSAIDAEVFGFGFLAMYDEGAESDATESLNHLILEAERSGRAEALALLRVLAHIGPATIRSAATDAADRLVGRGLEERPWAGDLGPGEWVSAHGYADRVKRQQTLTLEFLLGRRTYGLLLVIDTRLGGLSDCRFTFDVPRMNAQMIVRAETSGFKSATYTRARAGAILTAALASPPCPVDPDRIAHIRSYLPLLRSRLHLVAAAQVTQLNAAIRRPTADSTAVGPVGQVHRIKVTLGGMTPPIWRRLEVTSTTSLAELQKIIHTAFGWSGSHLWVFETARGEYGDPDPEMGFGDAAHVTLGTSAPSIGSKLLYLYDFGDDWRHAIVVEAIDPGQGDVHYPRCSAGRRASPPEDCGGPHAYGYLLDVLADSAHPEHQQLLETLNLHSAGDFQPAAFAVDLVNHSLSLL
jgi:hypothetical protein